jgi:hypothetical protein
MAHAAAGNFKAFQTSKLAFERYNDSSKRYSPKRRLANAWPEPDFK